MKQTMLYAEWHPPEDVPLESPPLEFPPEYPEGEPSKPEEEPPIPETEPPAPEEEPPIPPIPDAGHIQGKRIGIKFCAVIEGHNTSLP